MYKKRILQIIAMVLLLSLILSNAAFAMPPGQAKKLLENKNKYEKAFKHMKDKGIMIGYQDGNLHEEDLVKRGDITVMIVRAFKLSMMDVNLEKFEDDGFLDLIDKNSYYYKHVKIAKNLKIALGDGKNFYPDKFVTYEEALALIERAVKVANSNVTIKDGDKEIKLRDWYKDFVKNDKDAFSKELKGLFGKNFDFTDAATRRDIARMLYFVLTGDKDFDLEDDDEKEIKDIELYLEDFKGSFERIIRKGLFAKAFEDIEDDGYSVEYLVFDDIDKDQGYLYYKYVAQDGDDNEEAGDYNYYFDNDDKREIKDLTFVGGKADISVIEYTAYIYNKAEKDYDAYEGRIIISLADESLSRINVRIGEEETLDIEELGFKDFIQEIEFKPEMNTNVTLKINGEKLENKKYDIEDIDTITFLPKEGFMGTQTIDYVAYAYGMSYTGVIRVRVTD